MTPDTFTLHLKPKLIEVENRHPISLQEFLEAASNELEDKIDPLSAFNQESKKT